MIMWATMFFNIYISGVNKEIFLVAPSGSFGKNTKRLIDKCKGTFSICYWSLIQLNIYLQHDINLHLLSLMKPVATWKTVLVTFGCLIENQGIIGSLATSYLHPWLEVIYIALILWHMKNNTKWPLITWKWGRSQGEKLFVKKSVKS